MSPACQKYTGGQHALRDENPCGHEEPPFQTKQMLVLVVRTEETYVDGTSFEIYPASIADQYDIIWTVEQIPVKGGSLSPRQDNPISVEWNTPTGTWALVSKYPLTSNLEVTCDLYGPSCTMPIGSSRVPTSSREPIRVVSISPISDNNYNYMPQ